MYSISDNVKQSHLHHYEDTETLQSIPPFLFFAPLRRPSTWRALIRTANTHPGEKQIWFMWVQKCNAPPLHPTTPHSAAGFALGAVQGSAARWAGVGGRGAALRVGVWGDFWPPVTRWTAAPRMPDQLGAGLRGQPRHWGRKGFSHPPILLTATFFCLFFSPHC